MTIRAIDITYDTDPETASTLPKQLTFDVDEPEFNEWFSIEDLADLVSNETGFCVKDLSYVILKEDLVYPI